jgi:L-asparaginase
MATAEEIAGWGKGAVRLVSLLRGEEPDLVHFGMACLVDARGDILWSIGDMESRAFLRSSAKPLQAFPVLTSGAADAFAFTNRDLAIICGSHAGGASQASQVSGILAKSGLTISDLGCGDGVTDMCSGKHAGMLAACRHLGLPIKDYLDVDHPWQRSILASLCTHCGLETNEVRLAEDGCSAPTFSLPLFNMALGFARLAKSAAQPGQSQRLLQSMYTNPGDNTGEPDLRSFTDAGDLITKSGVHGVTCAALPGLGLGFALKVIDGSATPRWPVFTEALIRAGLISPTTGDRMRKALWPEINSRQGKRVGQIQVEF